MKYKILLAGKNKTVIDDLFGYLGQSIEPLTTSTRWNDIVGHIKYFKPDAFCFCIAHESKEVMNQMVSLKIRLEENKIPFVLIGTTEECDEFEREAVGTADLVLHKPLKVSAIEENLIKYIDDLHSQERLQKEEELRRAEENAKVRRHILVIDDDATMLKALKEQLHEQYDVATALSGKIAMKFLEKKTTDLILLDYEMPVENGPKVLEKLRENKATKNIPVLFLTGVTERSKITQVLSLKPQGYLLKPIEHDKLLMTIEKTLSEGFGN